MLVWSADRQAGRPGRDSCAASPAITPHVPVAWLSRASVKRQARLVGLFNIAHNVAMSYCSESCARNYRCVASALQPGKTERNGARQRRTTITFSPFDSPASPSYLGTYPRTRRRMIIYDAASLPFQSRALARTYTRTRIPFSYGCLKTSLA